MSLAELTFFHYALIAGTAFVTATIGGIAGYGTGLLMPLVLVPLVGAPAVVPIIGVSALFTNMSRVVAFRHEVHPRIAVTVTLLALPTCVLGAYGFTLLTGRGALFLIGTMLVLLVPARRILTHLRARLAGGSLALAGAGYGLLAGGTTGAGIILLSILMMAGLSGRAVVATDAIVSFAVGLVKTASFQGFGALPLEAWIIAVLVGCAGAPGAFVAKRLTENLSLRVHNRILEVAILTGGLVMIGQALRAP